MVSSHISSNARSAVLFGHHNATTHLTWSSNGLAITPMVVAKSKTPPPYTVVSSNLFVLAGLVNQMSCGRAFSCADCIWWGNGDGLCPVQLTCKSTTSQPDTSQQIRTPIDYGYGHAIRE